MKKSIIAYILILVLSIALAGSVGYIIRDKVVNKVENDNTKTSSTTSAENQSIEKTSENNNVEVDNTVNVENQNTDKTSAERDAQFLKKLKQQRESKKIEQGNSYNLLNCESGMTSVFLNYDGSLKIGDKTVDNNVLMFYGGSDGNGGCSFLNYIKEDGSFMGYAKNGPYKLDYKNIVSMSTNVFDDGRKTIFTDIDGNIVNK